METKHTPTPWAFGEQNSHCGISINDAEGNQVATAYLGLVTSSVERGAPHFALPENVEAVANARLIAAAPELLEALRLLRATWDMPGKTKRQLAHRAKAWSASTAAIAKATGCADT